MFPLKSKIINVFAIVVFGACCLFSVLGLIGIFMPGGQGLNRDILANFFMFIFLMIPWLALYVSISHYSLLKGQESNFVEYFE